MERNPELCRITRRAGQTRAETPVSWPPGGAFPRFPCAALTPVKPLHLFTGTDVTDRHHPGGSKQQE